MAQIVIDLTDTEVLDAQHVMGEDLATALPAYIKGQCATNWGVQRAASATARIVKAVEADPALKASAEVKAAEIEAQEVAAKEAAIAAEAAKLAEPVEK